MGSHAHSYYCIIGLIFLEPTLLEIKHVLVTEKYSNKNRVIYSYEFMNL